MATHLKTVVIRTPVNEWLDPMKETPSNEGAFLVSATPHREAIGGTGDDWGVLAGQDDKSYPWAVGFFFGNTELSM